MCFRHYLHVEYMYHLNKIIFFSNTSDTAWTYKFVDIVFIHIINQLFKAKLAFLAVNDHLLITIMSGKPCRTQCQIYMRIISICSDYKCPEPAVKRYTRYSNSAIVFFIAYWQKVSSFAEQYVKTCYSKTQCCCFIEVNH